MMIKLVVLLGNKGSLYKKSRHNSGWLFGEVLDAQIKEGLWNNKFHGQWNKFTINKVPLLVLKPLTVMNNSGQSVSEMASYFSVSANELLVIHDDLELPFLKARIQFGGPLAGHNGLRSIVQHLKTENFYRLRLGIGRPTNQDVSSYVLSKFSKDEEPLLPSFYEKAASELKYFISLGAPLTNLPIDVELGF
jgi:PTH1 family peptidyl-tRNA hydrolase